MTRTVTPPDVRFWAKVQRGADGECWPWTKGTQGAGYGAFHPTKDTTVLAHRYAYELAYGAIPAGMHVDHTCHNGTGCEPGPDCPHRRCCNPRHLDPTLPVQNVKRSHNANHRKTHCPRRHAYTEGNTRWLPPTAPGRAPRRACRECDREREQRRGPRSRRSK